MEALSKLIDVNRPDLCLFVGEALVGNDAVDQLKKFNQSLADMSTQVCPGACCRTEGYTHDANVWDLSIVQGPFSVAPCQTLRVTIRNFCIAVRHLRDRRACGPFGCTEGCCTGRGTRDAPHSASGLTGDVRVSSDLLTRPAGCSDARHGRVLGYHQLLQRSSTQSLSHSLTLGTVHRRYRISSTAWC
jgi:hypothetical protein